MPLGQPKEEKRAAGMRYVSPRQGSIPCYLKIDSADRHVSPLEKVSHGQRMSLTPVHGHSFPVIFQYQPA